MSNLHASTLPPLSTATLTRSTSLHHISISTLHSHLALNITPTTSRPAALTSLAHSHPSPSRGDALALSFAATLTLHMHTASRAAVRAAVVMRPAHASADRGRRRSGRRDQVRARFASARAALLSTMALERLMAGGNAAATQRVGSDRSSARCGPATPRSDHHSISTLHSITHTSMTFACRSC